MASEHRSTSVPSPTVPGTPRAVTRWREARLLSFETIRKLGGKSLQNKLQSLIAWDPSSRTTPAWVTIPIAEIPAELLKAIYGSRDNSTVLALSFAVSQPNPGHLEVLDEAAVEANYDGEGER